VGKPLAIETIDIEGPKAGEVLVEIKATGIGHTDQHALAGVDPAGCSGHPRPRGRGHRARGRRRPDHRHRPQPQA
jgi:Zn-dependent alcohol dehydrogenase